MSLPTLPPLPAVTTELPRGPTTGGRDVDPVSVGERRGRVRRWMDAAVGDATRAVGAAGAGATRDGTARVGTLPGPDGRPREVGLTGVTERHTARW